MSLVHDPLWYVSGPDEAKLMIVGQHHGDYENMPFTSPTGMHFRRLLEEAGLPVAKLAFCHAGRSTRVLCEDIGVSWVLACGDEALHVWRPDLRVVDCHGGLVLDGDLAIFPIYHHDVYRRDPKQVSLLLRELATLQRLAVARRTEGAAWHEGVTVY